MRSVVWAEPRNITSISDCYFYHTMDILIMGPYVGNGI